MTRAYYPGEGRKIGRNEPCPCRSGKKYKCCCGRQHPEQVPPGSRRGRFAQLYEEFRAGRERGTIFFFAAGNYGPGRNSINVFAKSPDVISTGASSLDGRILCNYSSRGIPRVPDSGPTVVAPGLAVFRLNLTPGMARSAKKIASDAQRLGKRMGAHYTIRRGTSFSSAMIAGLSELIRLERKGAGLPRDFQTTKRVLQSIALPMPGYDPWEVGAGFVNDYVVRQYLKKLARSSGKEYWPSVKDKRWWRLKMDLRFHLRAIQKIFGMVVALLLVIFGFTLLYKGLGTGFHAFVEYKGMKATLLNAAPGTFLVLCGTLLAGIILWRREVISTDQLELTQGGRIKRSSQITIQEMDDD